MCSIWMRSNWSRTITNGIATQAFYRSWYIARLHWDNNRGTLFPSWSCLQVESLPVPDNSYCVDNSRVSCPVTTESVQSSTSSDRVAFPSPFYSLLCRHSHVPLARTCGTSLCWSNSNFDCKRAEALLRRHRAIETRLEGGTMGSRALASLSHSLSRDCKVLRDSFLAEGPNNGEWSFWSRQRSASLSYICISLNGSDLARCQQIGVAGKLPIWRTQVFKQLELLLAKMRGRATF